MDLSTCREGFSTANIGHREHDVVLDNRERAAVKEDAVPGNVSLRRNLGWASKSWLPRHLLPCAAILLPCLSCDAMKHGTSTVKDIMPELFNSKISST